MKSVVLDASIILNYLFTETKNVNKIVTKILKQAEKKQLKLLSVSYLPLEVANGLRFKLKDPILAEEVIVKFMALPIKLYELSNPQLLQTTKLSYTMGTTIYDTAYHLLAIAHHATFLTCDHKYYMQANDLGSIESCG